MGGTLGDLKLKVIVEETESNAKLLGPAGANEIFVHEGSVLGVLTQKNGSRVTDRGVTTGISYSVPPQPSRPHDRRGGPVR